MDVDVDVDVAVDGVGVGAGGCIGCCVRDGTVCLSRCVIGMVWISSARGEGIFFGAWMGEDAGLGGLAGDFGEDTQLERGMSMSSIDASKRASSRSGSLSVSEPDSSLGLMGLLLLLSSSLSRWEAMPHLVCGMCKSASSFLIHEDSSSSSSFLMKWSSPMVMSCLVSSSLVSHELSSLLSSMSDLGAV